VHASNKALCHRQAFEIAVTYFAEDKSKASPDEFFNHFAQFRLSFQVRCDTRVI
jgi:hypothetical protein